MQRFKLGDRVRATAQLKKYEVDTQPHPYRMWAPAPLTPTTGYVMGKRVLANNYVKTDQSGGMPWAEESGKRITAYLVSYDMRREPLYVLETHMERIP